MEISNLMDTDFIGSARYAKFDVSEYIGLVEREKDLITLTRKCGSAIEQMQIKISELRERAILITMFYNFYKFYKNPFKIEVSIRFVNFSFASFTSFIKTIKNIIRT